MIVEDEPLSCQYLRNLLSEAFPEMGAACVAAAEDEAVAVIQLQRPDLIFLDIELQTGSGFGVVSRIHPGDAYIIFTSALNQRATNLLRLSGVPYIQKPIDMDSLRLAVEAAQDMTLRPQHAEALGHLRSSLRNGGEPLAMHVKGENGPDTWIALNDIVAIESEGSGSRLRLRSGAVQALPLEIKELDGLLRDFGFFRTHMQYIINRSQVAGPILDHETAITMHENLIVPVSSKKGAELRKFLAGGGPAMA